MLSRGTSCIAWTQLLAQAGEAMPWMGARLPMINAGPGGTDDHGDSDLSDANRKKNGKQLPNVPLKMSHPDLGKERQGLPTNAVQIILSMHGLIAREKRLKTRPVFGISVQDSMRILSKYQAQRHRQDRDREPLPPRPTSLLLRLSFLPRRTRMLPPQCQCWLHLSRRSTALQIYPFYWLALQKASPHKLITHLRELTMFKRRSQEPVDKRGS